MSGKKVKVISVGGKRDGQDRLDRMNPSRGLTVARAVRLMEAYPLGDYAELMWLFAAPFLGIESSDPDYLSIIERRVSAIKEMSYSIIKWQQAKGEVADATRAARAEAQYRVLYDAYERIENIYEAIEHLMMSRFRGFSLLEITANELLPVDHWNVRRDGSRGKWYWNESGLTGKPVEDCEPFDPDWLITMETERPIGRIALLKYIRANLSEQDWDHFVEIYGIPSGVVIAPDAVSEETLAEFQRAAERASRGADAAFPAGTQYHPNTLPTGESPFQARLEWLSQKLVQVGTGGYLTMLSMSGSGTLAGSAHLEAFKTLARADARDISAAFQQQFDKRLLEMAGLLEPGETPLAYFEISSREEQNTKDATQQVVSLCQFFDLDPQQVEERTGWIVSQRAEPTTRPQVGGSFREMDVGRPARMPAARPMSPDIERAAEALMADLQPARDLIGRALRDCGGDLRAAIHQIRDELPELREHIERGNLDEVLETTIAQAMAEEFEKLEKPQNGA